MNHILLVGILTFIIAFYFTKSLVPYLIKYGIKYNFIDEPEERKQHRRKIVRIGGISIFVGLFLTLIITLGISIPFEFSSISLSKNYLLLYIGMLSFFLIGLFEDFLTLSPFLRLSLQTSVVSILWGQGFALKMVDISFVNLNSKILVLSPIASYLISFFWLVGITNAINWLDGLDGLAAGIALVNFLGISLISFSLGNSSLFYLAIILSGCCMGFLVHNFNPSKIHMGDSGSYLIGFSLASLSILSFSSFDHGVSNYIFSFHKSIFLVFIPFFDMLFVIFSRLLRRKSPFLPDRSHLHFRLLKVFKNVRLTVYFFYLLTFLFTCISFLIR